MSGDNKAGASGFKAKLAYIPVITVICAGVALSTIVFGISRQWEQRNIKQELVRTAKDQVSLFREQTELYQLELESLAAFFAGSIKVERAEFTEYTGVFLRAHREVHGLAWAPRVDKSQADDYLEAAERDGFGDFQITEHAPDGQFVKAASRDEYFPVFYIEPFRANASILGFDLSSDQQILPALNKSRRTGRRTATPKLELFPQEREEAVFLIIQPVYYRGAATDSEEARLANLEGFAVGIFHVGAVLEAALALLTTPETKETSLFLYDKSAPAGERFLYSRVSEPLQEPQPPEMSEADIENGLYYSRTFAVADRRWQVICTPTPGYIEAHKSARPWWNLSSGLLLTAVVGSYLAGLVRRGEHIKQVVGRQTAHLEREISDHKKVEEALTLRNRAISNATNGVIITEHHNTFENPIVYVNPAFERITGYSLEEVRGRDCRFLQKDDRKQPGVEEVRKALRQRSDCRTELRNYRKDGSLFWNELSISPVRDERGRVTHHVAIMSDVTERKLAEEQLRNLTDTLESRNKELRTYTTIVRHDLGNQLLSINAFNSVLAKSCEKLGKLLKGQKLRKKARDEVFSVLTNEIFRTTDNIKVGTGQMGSLLEGFKRLADVGYVEINIEPIDMNRLLQELIGAMQAEITNRGASLTVEELPDCFGDRGQVGQVFGNLLNNALKYLDPNRKGQIRIRGKIESDQSIYCVQDNGIGIAPEEQEKVFDAFHRVDAKDRASGEGLGLSIVMRILERLNGNIRLESQPGRGSSFYVSLPATREIREERDIQ